MMPGLLQGLGSPMEEGVGPQPGFPPTSLHSGSRFTGFQQSKGNRYQVEVIFKVSCVECTKSFLPALTPFLATGKVQRSCARVSLGHAGFSHTTTVA